jgi:hypothetical protein
VALKKKACWTCYVWSLVAVGIAVYAADNAYRSYSRLTVQLVSFGGVTLGDTRGEVRYKRGEPPVVYGMPQPGEPVVHGYFTDPRKNPSNALPDGTETDTFPSWAYSNNDTLNAHFDVTFDAKSGRVAAIDCVDQSDPPTSYCERVAGLGIWDPEGRITSLLGAPTQQSIDELSSVKTMEYSDIGLAFLLKRQRIFAIYLYGTGSPKQVPTNRLRAWLASTLALWWQT